MSQLESTCSSSTDVSGQQRICAGWHHPLSGFLDSFQTTRRFAKQMTGYSKTEHPFSRIRLNCSFDEINFDAFEVPLDSRTRGTSVPQSEPRTS